ncbi:MAG: hypothetical protein WB795_20015 [Candidatus Acidiferrales bacterium]
MTMRRLSVSRSAAFLAIAFLLFVAGPLLLAAPCSAHVGSPDVYFQGQAGPYPITVTVRTPSVIPGIAVIEVRAADPSVQQIHAVPLYILGPGSKYPPVPDLLARSKNDPQFFSGSMWLMSTGSWQIQITADGPQGSGATSVPVPAAARGTLPMTKALAALLVALMLLIVVALISIFGAARREGSVEPGQAPSPQNLRRARMVMAITAAVLVLALAGGNIWWDQTASARSRRMIYAAPALRLSLQPDSTLQLHIEDNKWHSSRPDAVNTELISDHGYLMHLFLIRTPGMDRFYHLHPRQVAGFDFVDDLPPLPAGHYQVFADIVRSSGFPDTMVSEIDLPDISGKPLAGDDSETVAPPLSNVAAKSSSPTFSDGDRMVWERDASPLVANRLLLLQYRLEGPDGKPATDVEPFLGMAGHMEIVRSDRSVFAHIHPDGTVSMAALSLADQSLNAGKASPATPPASGSSMAMSMAMPAPGAGGSFPATVTFPYGFPKPGAYRLFVQMKHSGHIVTGVFDCDVQ